MEQMITHILIWLGGMALLVAALPEKRAKRVESFVKTVLRLLPISAIANAFTKKKDE